MDDIERRALMGLIAAGALTPVGARGQAVDAANPLKYLDTAQRLTVKAHVNGQGPFDFLVDTGASSSVIATELADQLGLVLTGSNKLHSIAGAQSVSTARVDSLAVGKRSRTGMTVSVLPRALLRVDGVLGLEWLGRASLLLDFLRQKMTVGEGLPLADDLTVAVKSRLARSGLMLIDAFIPGERLIAFIDTGSTTSVGNLALLEAAREAKAIVGELADTQLRSVTGQVLPARATVVSRLMLGKLTLRNVPLLIGQVHTFDFWGFGSEPAIVVGIDILRKFQSVAIDSKRGEVRFRVPG
ncbi:retropepsin-like aspartic protease [Caulobacter sp. RL271]|uniref:Retroviral-like aspartic protease family protein n=1 Tax=Caulobacter segnis TaxID=88688 RepID=A0ABY4ZP13_9CAUL|nr:retropepsin-like aspartic protease [Caulobacter segnis]USQ94410.1 retroviral-like aspartic protease family protein [Caulobacter segnis]